MYLFPTDQPSLPQKLPSIQSTLFPFSVAQPSSISFSAPGFQVFLSITTLRTVLLYKSDTTWFLSNPSFSLELGPCLTLPMNFREYPRLEASLYIHLSFPLPQIIWNLVVTFNTFPKVSCLKLVLIWVWKQWVSRTDSLRGFWERRFLHSRFQKPPSCFDL